MGLITRPIRNRDRHLQFRLLDPSGNCEIAPGDSIASTEVSATTRDGNDPSPGAIILGSQDISQAPLVLQRVTAGVSACNYHLRCVATLASTNEVVRECVLPVRQRR